MMSTQTYVLGWATMVVLIVMMTWGFAQLSRPDDDWKGWTE
jgi:hypothetical protein